MNRTIKRRADRQGRARRKAGRSCTNEERKRAALIGRRGRSTSPHRRPPADRPGGERGRAGQGGIARILRNQTLNKYIR